MSKPLDSDLEKALGGCNEKSFGERERQARNCVDQPSLRRKPWVQQCLPYLTKALDGDESARDQYTYLVMIEQALKLSSLEGLESLPVQALAEALPQLAMLKGYKSSARLQDLMFELLRLANHRRVCDQHPKRTKAPTEESSRETTSGVPGNVGTRIHDALVRTSIPDLSPKDASHHDEDAWADTQPDDPAQQVDTPVPIPRPPVNWGINMPDSRLFWW